MGRGTNYGWSCREGRHDFNQAQPLCVGPPPPVLTDPVFEYPHSGGQHTGCSITGGYVVRDPALPAVFGRYVYGDACNAADLAHPTPGPRRAGRHELWGERERAVHVR